MLAIKAIKYIEIRKIFHQDKQHRKLIHSLSLSTRFGHKHNAIVC